ncbi:hypothetical protein CYY_001658 [Polysphondylium violaceum]|uniref:FNIP repeat-containing protein n=1 Tax=Polysphondylium violaceum TaxID=133409 RepID=A0A8J4UVZ9_9MYCE|nr:hypothetical protein CYY_001658 [Polysphondylium violaceum]
MERGGDYSSSLFFRIWRNQCLQAVVWEKYYEFAFSTIPPLGVVKNTHRYQVFVTNQQQFDQIHRYNPAIINCYGRDAMPLDKVPHTVFQLKCIYQLGFEIPRWITHLTLKQWKGLDFIPESVTHLKLYRQYYYLHYMNLKIPASVVSLTLHSLYDIYQKPISSIIPATVRDLVLLKQPIDALKDADVPLTVKSLRLTSLLFDNQKNPQVPEFLNQRKILNGNGSVFQVHKRHCIQELLTNNVTHLFFTDRIIRLGDIPDTGKIHTLVLCDRFNSVIEYLPPTITSIQFGCSAYSNQFKLPLSSIPFPPRLKYLEFTSLEQEIYKDSLPNTITHLTFHRYYHSLENIPQSVTNLRLLECHYEFKLPPTIKNINISGVKKTLIPDTVQTAIGDYNCLSFESV